METIEEQSMVVQDTVCASCGMPADHLQRTPLCTSCRTQFIAYPIPVWIKVFGGVLLCILLFSLSTLPKNIKTGMHYKRGEKAISEKNYLTAEREFQNVLQEEPDYLDAKCQLLIASFHNTDLSVFFKTSESLSNKQIDDEALFSNMQQLVNRAITYLPKDSFASIMQHYNMQVDSVPEVVYRSYLASFPNDYFAAFRFAGILTDQDRYREADSVINQLLGKDPEYYGALVLKASMKREQMQIDSSYYYIDHLLKANQEDVTALSSKVRTLLKEKKDDAALNLALQTTAMNDAESYSLASLALAYHFKNNLKDRDKVIQKIAADSSASGTLSYVNDIVSGKKKFRN